MSRRVKVLVIASLLVLLVLPAQASFAASECVQYHTVTTGENLYRISLQYNVSMSSLQAWNGISNANRILIGQRLCVAVGSGGYVVQPGDTLYSIGRYFGVSVWTLAQANNISNVNRIYSGQWLMIP